MEESKLLRLQSAPYLELDNYKAPDGINAYFVIMDDGIKIRVCYWINKKNNCRGTILLQQGHNEFIEKYYETIQEFMDRDYSVISFDWRGQGMSDHQIDDIHKAFIKDFKRHDLDLKYILEEIIEENFPKPLIGIGHSMGGCLMLSAFHDHEKKFDLGILSAPMLGFKNEKFLKVASSLMNFFKKDTDYLLGSRPNMGIETPFELNDLTTDKKRYERIQKLVKMKPSIRLWGVTNSFAKSVNRRFKVIRNDQWISKIKTKILIFNSVNDRVVDGDKTAKLAKKIVNCKTINLIGMEHEIFMEKDEFREKFWKNFDMFVEENINF